MTLTLKTDIDSNSFSQDYIHWDDHLIQGILLQIGMTSILIKCVFFLRVILWLFNLIVSAERLASQTLHSD